MGVRGLLSFIKNNKEYFSTQVNLSNTSLVIDAFNLLMWLDVKDEGLVSYVESVREFFDNLRKCNIKPILVFGGPIVAKAELVEAVKSDELYTHQDCSEKFIQAKKAARVEVDSVPSLTLRMIFKNVASELGVEMICTPYQRSDVIARLANELDCPALTSDSDFIIYQLKRGFVNIDSFDYKKPVPGSNATGESSESGEQAYSIRCPLFNRDKLDETLPGIRKEIMPVFSILLDENYTAAKSLDKLRWSICNGRHYGGDLFVATTNFYHKRFANLFTWMQGKNTLKEATDYILDSVDQSNRPKIEKLIDVCLRKYNLEMIDDFDRKLAQVYPNDKVDQKLVELGQTPVHFLKRLLEQDELSAIALHMMYHKQYCHESTPDDHTQPSSRYVEFRPYSLALVLLRNKSLAYLDTHQQHLEADKNVFFTYERYRSAYAKREVKYMRSLEKFGSLDHLDCYSMITMEPELKKKMLLACFYSDKDKLSLMTDTVARVVLGPYVQEAALCFMLVNYIGVETKQAPKSEFVDALMLTIFYYAALSGYTNKDNIPDEDAFDGLLLTLDPFSKSTKGKRVYANKSQQIEWRIWHCMSQLNYAYRAYQLINPLLDHAFHSPRLERFLNQTLVFRLTKMFHLGELTLQDLCADLPSLIEVCDSIQVQAHCTK